MLLRFDLTTRYLTTAPVALSAVLVALIEDRDHMRVTTPSPYESRSRFNLGPLKRLNSARCPQFLGIGEELAADGRRKASIGTFLGPVNERSLKKVFLDPAGMWMPKRLVP